MLLQVVALERLLTLKVLFLVSTRRQAPTGTADYGAADQSPLYPNAARKLQYFIPPNM